MGAHREAVSWLALIHPASVGVMSAVYAIVVPMREVPSGVLADRWSQGEVLTLASRESHHAGWEGSFDNLARLVSP